VRGCVDRLRLGGLPLSGICGTNGFENDFTGQNVVRNTVCESHPTVLVAT
jgi:hypothetical protein